MINVSTLSMLVEEHTRATCKHDWTGYSIGDMSNALVGEINEVGEAEAKGDIHGPHGMRAELLQVAVVALRMYDALERVTECATP